MAYGWSGGKIYPDQRMIVLRAKDSHAWTEIKLDGYGWVIFDTTPPDGEGAPSQERAAQSEVPPDPYEEFENMEEEYYEDKEEEKEDRSVFFIWLGVALGIAVIIAGGFLFLRYRLRPMTDDAGKPSPFFEPGYMQTFRRACASIGIPMSKGSTLKQQLILLEKENVCPEFLHDLVHYHYARVYEGARHDTRREKSLRQAVLNWQKEYSSGLS